MRARTSSEGGGRVKENKKEVVKVHARCLIYVVFCEKKE